jgi:hypothetical protein
MPTRRHHDSLEAVQASRLSVSRDNRWQSHCQMLIASVGRHKQWMIFVIVQDNERTTPQNLWKRVLPIRGESSDRRKRRGSGHRCKKQARLCLPGALAA